MEELVAVSPADGLVAGLEYGVKLLFWLLMTTPFLLERKEP
jgi:hypothetical protein